MHRSLRKQDGKVGSSGKARIAKAVSHPTPAVSSHIHLGLKAEWVQMSLLDFNLTRRLISMAVVITAGRGLEGFTTQF